MPKKEETPGQLIARLKKRLRLAVKTRQRVSDPKASIYYVYALIDPRDGLPFYIGKGTGNRCHTHAKVAKQNVARDNWKKRNRIRSIQKAGLNVPVAILEKDLTEIQAFRGERKEIARCRDAGIELTNFNSGGSFNYELLRRVHGALHALGRAADYEAMVLRRDGRFPTEEEWKARDDCVEQFMHIRQMVLDKITKEEEAA